MSDFEPDITKTCDVLIIGGGAAGARAAIEADRGNVKVLLVCKGLFAKSGCSPISAGGYNASFGHVDEKDDWETHMRDSVKGGECLNNQELLEIFAKESPMRLQELETFGSLFDRQDNGMLYQRYMGGHSYKRTVCSGDKTGLEIMQGLKREVYRRDVEIIEELFISKLLTKNGKLVGAVGWLLPTGQFVVIRAKTTIMAAGGAGRLWWSTYTFGKTGDPFALAIDAGAELVDMEFFQFFPTGVMEPDSFIAVSESARGEGGRMYNRLGERFMLKYDPERKELAPRDFISLCIWKELKEGRGTENGGVYLNLSHLPHEQIERRIPGTMDKFMAFGYDVRNEAVIVTPIAHYTMGGLKFNEKCETNVPALYVCGEAMGGLHGANRLGGNSLPDLLVFGARAGKYAAEYTRSNELEEPDMNQAKEENDAIHDILNREPVDGISPFELRKRHEKLMWEKVGVVRNRELLDDVLKEFDAIKKDDLPRVKLSTHTRIYNPELLEALEMRFRLETGKIVANSALIREESRGGHYRSDFPAMDNDNWLKNTVVWKENGSLKTRFEPTVITKVDPKSLTWPKLPAFT